MNPLPRLSPVLRLTFLLAIACAVLLAAAPPLAHALPPTPTHTPSPPMTTIEGVVFLDSSRNGRHDGGESGLPVPVTIQLYRNGFLINQKTTSGGWYGFTGLTAGVTYEVHEIQPVGYESTSPDTIVIPHPGGRVTEVNFGEYFQSPTPTPTPIGMRVTTVQQGLAGYGGARDAHLDRYQPDAPRGDRQTLYFATYAPDGEARSILLDFDLSPLALPPDAWVVFAKLSLYQYNQVGDTNLTVAAYGLHRAWQEPEATWNRASQSDAWAVPGANAAPADRSPDEAAVVNVGPWVGWKTWDVTAIVQAWVQQPSQQFGLKLEALAHGSGQITAYFHSREADAAELRPRLEIAYVIPTVTPTATATDTPTATPSPTATEPTGPLPDLVVTGMTIVEATVVDCQTIGPLGTLVAFRNAGDADAGPFVIDVNGVTQTVDGLAAGADASLFFEGYAFGQESVATVDVTEQVTESDEMNNTFTEMVPIPTPRATCTPTVTPTPTATPTATPTVAMQREYLPFIVQ